MKRGRNRSRACTAMLLTLGSIASPIAGQQRTDVVDSLIQAKMTERHVVGAAVAVVLRGQVVKSAAYGFADAATNERVTPQTAFFVASITKAFSGAAVMSLVQDGKLRLDDRAGVLLPNLPAPWHEVNVRQLLAHTSALPDVEAIPGVYMGTFEAALDQLRDLPLRGTPGAEFQYTQTNWVLLAKIVEMKTGQPFADYVTRRIIAPTGIQSASFGAYDSIGPGRARWYTTAVQKKMGELEFGPVARPLHTDYPSYMWPAAGLYMSAQDLAVWVDAFAGGKVIERTLVDSMWAPVRLANGKASPQRLARWARWAEDEFEGMLINGGARATVVHVPERGLTVAVLTNTQGAGEGGWVEEVLNIYLRNESQGTWPGRRFEE